MLVGARSRRETTTATRDRLVSAAITQVAEDGMRALTHRRVEQRAGVSQGLVKYHFGSLDGLIEAVVQHMADLEIDSVPVIDADLRAAALAGGEIHDSIWQAARRAFDTISARPDLLRARFELYLHAAKKPELQDIIRKRRERFIRATAVSLGSADYEAGARMVLALLNGLLLQQLSAPDDLVGELAPAYLIAAGQAALTFPLAPYPGP